METKRIKEIKKSDAFDTLGWLGDDLKKYNLIYGWNGSGKTTISRIFNFLERRVIHIPDLSAIEFVVQTDAGNIKQTDLITHALNVRVFNEDFVDENLLFEQSQAKKIVILGKENVATQKEIEALEAEHGEKGKSIETLEGQIAQIPDLSQILTKAGSEVPQHFAGTPLATTGYYGRNYNKTKVDKRLENGSVNESNLTSLIVSPIELDAKKDTIKNERKNISMDVIDVPDFSKLFVSANDLLTSSVPVMEIDELKDDKPLRDWIEAGYRLHKDRKLSDCQFCKGALPDELLVKLGGFFTDELEKAKAQIDSAITSLGSSGYAVAITGLEPNAFFPDLVSRYETAKNDYILQTKAIEGTTSLLINELKQKIGNLHDHTKIYTPIVYPGEIIKGANVLLKKMRDIIVEHNRRVVTIADEVQKAAEAIELHIIAKTLSDREYFKHKKESERIRTEIDKLKKERCDLDGRIKTKKASLHNATDAVEKINAILKEFFGGEHIYLEVAETAAKEIQYILKRRDKFAKHLSEGEASVLALVYFLIKLEEDGFHKKDCLIIIDDPVDSQDSIFLFRTAGLLKRQLKDAGQLVVLTHNFEFFNLIRDWYLSKQLEDESALFLISLNKVGDPQEAKIENLPVLLREYKSEYQYLFSRLYKYANDIEPLDEPLVANIARKVLEYFSSFKWSCKTTEGLLSIVNSRFIANTDQLKKGTGDFVVKFLHEYSHGQDFSRSISASMLESKEIAKNVLEFIRLADGEHYGDLKSLCETIPLANVS